MWLTPYLFYSSASHSIKSKKKSTRNLSTEPHGRDSCEQDLVEKIAGVFSSEALKVGIIQT